MIRRLVARPTGVFAVIVLGLLVVLAAVSLFWTPQDPFRADPFHQWEPPGAAHWFGTDASGRDIASYLLAGTRTTVLVAVGSGVIASVVGIVLTAIGSLTARWVREGTAVLLDILVAFPTLLTAMLLTAIAGGSLGVVIVSVGLSFGVTIARVARGEIRRIARSDYVTAARASGVGGFGVLFRHLIPNAAPLFTVQLLTRDGDRGPRRGRAVVPGLRRRVEHGVVGQPAVRPADLHRRAPVERDLAGRGHRPRGGGAVAARDAVRDATDPRLTTNDRADDRTATDRRVRPTTRPRPPRE
ncbi:ABC transporter permease [Curtobacterium flaccumfaciens]|nr:ABC transporter permease [Curtobacterium flaccumfaciens]